MVTGRTDEFRKDAVRIALTSGLSRRQVAEDLGVGMSSLNKWGMAHRDTDMVSSEDRKLALENERLRREICILQEERDILKKSHPGLRAPKVVMTLPGRGLPCKPRKGSGSSRNSVAPFWSTGYPHPTDPH